MSMDYVTQLLDAGISTMSDQLLRVELDAQPFDFKELRHCIMMEQIRDAYYESNREHPFALTWRRVRKTLTIYE